MKHLLVDFDSTIPNLALMKVSTWARARGDGVELVKVLWKNEQPLVPIRFFEISADECWVSCIFTWHRRHAESLKHYSAKMHYGGTGFDWGLGDGLDFSQRVNLPSEIEACMPDYSLYPDDERALGFCLRGCNRTCGFCDVWRKEGKIRRDQYNRITEWVPNDRSKVLLLDNDIALYGNDLHDEIINDCASTGRKLSITQGYDIRCVTEKRAAMLAEHKPWDLKFKEKRLYIAWDKMSSENAVRRNIPLLLDAGFKGREIFCYMVCSWEDYPEHGEDYFPMCDTFHQDMYRFKVLWEEFGVYPFVMIYNNRKDNPRLRAFARWVNRRVHKNHSWEEYDRNPDILEEEYDVVEQLTLG